ncbi:MAG: histidine kinase, partial [Acidobacteriota bacterium]
GEGISPEDLPRVFEAGFTTRKRGLGTGLGLAISERIVQEHGGSIQVTSEPKRGSTFTIRLPLWTTASSAENSSERSPT